MNLSIVNMKHELIIQKQIDSRGFNTNDVYNTNKNMKN